MKKSAQKHLPPETRLPSQDQLAYEQAVNRRAYELWEVAGSLHGDDLRHWLEAECEMRALRQAKSLVEMRS